MLMEHSFIKAKDMGYDVIVIFGSPVNYISSGFKSCKKHNISIENEKYPSAMLNSKCSWGAQMGLQSQPCYEYKCRRGTEIWWYSWTNGEKFLPSQEEFYIMSRSFIE